jgi:spermidine/putrescine transport system permease protein
VKAETRPGHPSSPAPADVVDVPSGRHPRRWRPRDRDGTRGLQNPLLALPAVSYVAVLFFVPLVILVLYSLWRTQNGQVVHDWTLEHYSRFFEESAYWRTLLRTLWFVALASLITVALTFPFAYFVAVKVPPRRRLFWILIAIVPFWTSYLIRVFAWVKLFGDTGVINYVLMESGLVGLPLEFFDFDRPAIVITFVYLLFPLGFLTSYIALERIDSGLLEGAADLGARPWRALTRITLPLARTGLVAGFVFSFITMMGDYVTPTLVGGSNGVLFSNLVINQFGNSQQWGFGATLAIVMLLTVFALLVALRRLTGGVEAAGEYTRRFDKRRAPFLFVYSLGFLLFLYSPILLLTLFAFNDSETVGFPIYGLTTRWFSTAFQNSALIDAFWLSLQVAVTAVALSLAIGSVAAVWLARARGRLRSLSVSVIALPLFLPPVVLGLGLIIGFNAIDVQRDVWTIVLGHLLLTLPIVVLLLVVRLEGLDPNQELAAMDLGARPWKVFLRVVMPQALPAVLAAALLGFAVSMDEFILTFLVTGADTTLPLYIYGSIRFQFTPELNAAAAMMLGASFVLLFLGAGLMWGRAALGRRRGHRPLQISEGM